MGHIYDMIVVGGGPAGYTAALYGARAGLDTLVIEKMSAGGQMTITDVIENYPGFDEGILGFELGMRMQNGAERFGAKSTYDEVLSLSADGDIKIVVTASGEYKSRTVVIATGASPRELKLDGERELVGKGIHYCAHCDGRFYKDKKVMVVGGGNTAVSDAIYLSRLAKKVILVHRRDTLRATKLYVDTLLSLENVEIILDSSVSELLYDERILGAKIKNLKSGAVRDIQCDGIFVSIGREPVTEFLFGTLELDSTGYIIADESTETNIEGVYAVGDVRTKELRQVVTATADGAVAAHMAEHYISKKNKI